MQITFTEEIAKIQPRGILTIPKKLRRSMGLADNTFVKISGNKYRLIIEPVRVLPYPVRSYNDNEIKDFFDLDASESKQLKTKGLL
jgi:AbrB family looped-hinge helix DNA binding protein